jgi:2-(1,2-epoxy-1,2-dihydrophenyl)acetyl-CoA isomerase
MAPMETYRTIRYEAADGIGRLTLDRPERLNGMTNGMLQEAYECLADVARDPAVRVLVLTGAGRGFCPGADLRHYTGDSGDAGFAAAEAAVVPRDEDFRVPVLLHEMPQVTVAAVNGACAGAGLGWAAACDLRVAARSANFATAFLNVGVAGDMGGPWSLTHLLGAAKARELYFLGAKFSAAEALALGFVSRVWDDEVFRDEVDALVTDLAGKAPLALAGMKANFTAAERMGFADFVTLETQHHHRITSSEDCREAFAAFVEKRAPRYVGR